ncbi:MAG TPA: ATP-binding protein [Usitatibacter sp.]|nr:ATP-binding protein [Usitatibacter sp.]
MTLRLVTCGLHSEADVVGARQRARQIAELLGFNGREQTRIATSVSEVARNAWRYARGGRVEFEVDGEQRPQSLVMRIVDEGPGIERLDEILDGTYRSRTGMGIGLTGVRRLMDEWDVATAPGRGTTVTLGKRLPAEAPPVTAREASRIATRLAAMPSASSTAELEARNAELLAALTELQEKHDRLVEIERELEDTNRGVMALYAELDEKALHLRRADEMKSRFLSNMSHEFRTPLNSIRALCGLLLAQADGPLAREQETQVRFIAKAAEGLSELVNDLLDLAKIEAGKVDVRPTPFEVHDLFSALRGMLRPLLVTPSVDLVFDDAAGLPPLITDETKVSQILRNFISNALKFTEHGTVRVSAALHADGRSVVFSVADTGIGIAPEDQEMIFEEFTQVPSHLQRKVRGTGLGLPLCRRLAGLLGGEVSVRSAPGEGSTFFARIPVRHRAPEGQVASVPASQPAAAGAFRGGRDLALIIDDDEMARYVIRQSVRRSMRFAEARDGPTGLQMAASLRPGVIFLDLSMPGMEGDEVLGRLKADPQTASIPVVIVTSRDLDEQPMRQVGAMASAVLRKSEVSAEAIARVLDTLEATGEAP